MRVSQRHQAAAQAAAASASWPALAGQRRLKHLISSEMLVITNLAFFTKFVTVCPYQPRFLDFRKTINMSRPLNLNQWEG